MVSKHCYGCESEGVPAGCEGVTFTPITPVMLRDITKECNARQIADKHLQVICDKVNAHFSFEAPDGK